MLLAKLTFILLISHSTYGWYHEKTRFDRSIDSNDDLQSLDYHHNSPAIFVDYTMRYVAYKSTEDNVCYLEKMRDDNWKSILAGKIRPKILYPSLLTLTIVEAWKLAGGRVVNFCEGNSIKLLQEVQPAPQDTEDPFLNEIPHDENDIFQKRVTDVVLTPLLDRAKREIMLENREKINERERVRTRRQTGKFRGQTQSQYLNFEKDGEKGGKAEAEATKESSRALVSGSNGMGQAQSMSAGGLGCEDCPGYQKFPSEVPPGYVRLPGGAIVPGSPGVGVPGRYPGIGGPGTFPGGVIPPGGGQTYPGTYPGGVIPPGGGQTYPGGVIPPGGGQTSPGTYPGGVIPPGGGQTTPGTYPGGVIPPGGGQTSPGTYPGGVIPPGGGQTTPGTYPGGVIPPGGGQTYPGGVIPPGGGQTFPGTYPGGVIPPGGGQTYPGTTAPGVGQPGTYPGSNVPGVGQPGTYPGGSVPGIGYPGTYPGSSIPGVGQPGTYPGSNVPGVGQPGPYPGGNIPGIGQPVPGTPGYYPGGVSPPGGTYPGGAYQPGVNPPGGYPGTLPPGGAVSIPGSYPGIFPPGTPGTYPGTAIPGTPGTYPGTYPGYPTPGGGIYPGGVAPPGGTFFPGTTYPGGVQYPPGAVSPAADDADSHASSSVKQTDYGTQASASADGKYGTGTAQSQVSGVYTGSGSFSAQAGINDGNKGAQTQVSGGKEGAMSNAQGFGGHGKSQTQVQLDSETGATTTGSQSSGFNHDTSSQVQASIKGGMADAQANGEGSTSSQAQIGFQPYMGSAELDKSQSKPFKGGGTASAQSGTYQGQSQSQIEGSFQYGITYTGAAQAGSGSGAASSRKPFNFTNSDPKLFKTFEKFEPLKITNDHKEEPPSPAELDTTITGTQTLKTPSSTRKTVFNRAPSRQEPPEKPQDSNFEVGAVEYDADDDGDYEDEDYSAPAPGRMGEAKLRNADSRQIQSINLGPAGKHDVHVKQDSSRPKEGDVLQPGDSLPGYKVPPGLRARVTSVSGERTQAQGNGKSQAQTVILAPNPDRSQIGKFVPPDTRSLKPGHAPNSIHTSNPRKHTASGNTRSMTAAPVKSNYYTVTNSVAGKMGDPRQKYEHRYYTKSSTCGYFTFSCNIVHGSNGRTKICKPKMPTYPDGTPMKC